MPALCRLHRGRQRHGITSQGHAEGVAMVLHITMSGPDDANASLGGSAHVEAPPLVLVRGQTIPVDGRRTAEPRYGGDTTVHHASMVDRWYLVGRLLLALLGRYVNGQPVPMMESSREPPNFQRIMLIDLPYEE